MIKFVNANQVKVGDKVAEADGYLLDVIAVNGAEITFKSMVRTFTQKFRSNKKLAIYTN